MNSRVIRVGLVGPTPPPNGGMAMQTEQLLRLLREEGMKITLLPVNAPYRPAFVSRIPGLRAVCRLLPYLVAAWRLAGRVDVIHLMANSGWSWQLFAAPVLWLASWRATPVVVNYRGGEARDYLRHSFRRVKPSLDRATAVVVPSGYLQEVFAEFGQATEVVPNIIDRNLFRPRSGQREPARHEQPSFDLVITRNLEPIYGIDTAIRALAQVRAGGAAVRLFIAGCGPAEQDLKALVAELGLEDAVVFVGRLDRAGVVALYAAADAMVNPTQVDNMPNSVLEALACGLPVISTNVGGVPYIVEHEETALLVPSRDPDALANAILRLRSDPVLRRRLSDNGLSEVESYTWDQVRERWFEVYHAAIAGSGKSEA